MNHPIFQSSFLLPGAAATRLPAAMQDTLCPGDRPLALLPVRLETRFFAQPDGSSELRVRIYPDKIHLDSHEPELAPGEREWGVHYWELDWRAGNDGTARADAWRQLADRFGDPRAAWIARLLRPTNPQQRPTAPVPPAQPLPVAPQFPAVAVASDNPDAAWRHPPRARLLPDRWVAVVQSRGQPLLTAQGRDIVGPLAVGPDPRAAAAEIPADQLAVDAGMRWMIDFDAAEQLGMALRLAIPAGLLALGIDALFVLGVAATAGSAGGAAALADLLDAHHYTDGLEFLRLGTPTNNTADRRAGYSSADPGHARSYATEVLADPAALAADSNALRLGLALGLPGERVAAALGRVDGAAGRHDLDLRSMNAALWQPGWGYFLSNLVGFDGTGLTPALLGWAREHFVGQVRSGGPFPTLRCGRQPYGVLPVTSLDLWQPRAGEEVALAPDSALRGLLLKLRDTVWRPHLGAAARVGRTSPPDPDADLADVMRTDAVSSSYVARTLLGRHYLQHLRAFLGEDLQADGYIAAQDAVANQFLQRLGIGWRSRLARATYAELPFRVRAPLVQAGEISPWRRLEPDYIGALLQPGAIAALLADPLPSASPTPMLQALLRHALLRELADATAQIAAGAPGASLAALLRDIELVDLVGGSALSLTWRRQLGLKVAAITGNQTIGQFLAGLTAFDAPAVAALGDFRRSLAHLQALDSEALQGLMQGTLDLSCHRLDAWITSFATKRLAALRATAPTGVVAGGYGWVENLQPLAAGAAPQVPPPPGEPGPLQAAPRDSGFIHAPSLTHAAAAALLRNAHLGAAAVPQAEGPFAIDLSSRRVREAAQLLDGVRQGQPLGALLGYRFERRLHELGLDTFIAPLRDLAPLVARKLEQTPLPLEAIAAQNVVDGLVLQRKWLDDHDAVLARLQQASPIAAEQTLAARELDALGDAIDGLGDALTAEAAYQMARGNTSRTAATLAAIAHGDAPPPELEVTRTPRSGTALTHRLLVLFSGAPGVAAGWAPAARSVRATAEPMLNGWAATLLGDPRKVRCTVERLDAGTGAVVETRVLHLSDLQLAPLDAVYAVEALAGPPRAGATLDVLEQLVLYQALHGGFGSAGQLRLQHARPAALAAGELTLLDVLEQARAVRRLLAGARGADAEDLNPPERASNGTADLAELQARVEKAEQNLLAARKALDTLARAGVAATAEALRASLLKLGGFGLAPAVPVVATGDDAAARSGLVQQATVLLKDAQARLDRGAALRAQAVAADPRARCGQLLDRMRAVFGSDFVLLPRCTCTAAAAAELAAALAASTQAQAGDTLAAHTWFARSARVREPVARLGACLRGAEVLNTGSRLALKVAQLPYASGERWVGLPSDAGQALPPGKVSLVLQVAAAFDSTLPLSGLWVDEWIELVPSRTETTALAFQFDPPDACAPQCLLLAVPPVPDTAWTVASLHRVLAETLDLAKLRAVDAELLTDAGQFLPALYFAFNASGDAVSTDFAALTK